MKGVIMAKSPNDPREIFPEIIKDYEELFGKDLIGITLYGSASGADYRPGKSDINFMIVLSEDGIEHLDRAFDVVRKWRKRNVAIPLFLTEAYVERSLDVFPIEYLNLQHEYILVYGNDVLKDLEPDPRHIRLQCEREIKGKLLLLREAYLETGGKGKALKEVMVQSLPAFIAIFKALLLLKDQEPPKNRLEVIRNACEAFDLDAVAFERTFHIKTEKEKLSDQELSETFTAYLKEVRKLSKIVDAMGG